jgi:hypothetical protein
MTVTASKDFLQRSAVLGPGQQQTSLSIAPLLRHRAIGQDPGLSARGCAEAAQQLAEPATGALTGLDQGHGHGTDTALAGDLIARHRGNALPVSPGSARFCWPPQYQLARVQRGLAQHARVNDELSPIGWFHDGFLFGTSAR